MNRNKTTAFPWAAGAVFLLLLAEVLLKGGSLLDDPVYGVIGRLVSPGLTPAVLAITFFGSVAFLVGAAAVLCLFAWKRWGLPMAAVCAANLAGASLCNTVLKKLVQRPRPAFIMVEESSFSFPSGHSLSSMAFYGFLILLVLWLCRGKKAAALCVGLGVLILLIGLSRIYLGAHYASDVLAGFCEGLVWLSLYCRIPAVNRVLCGLRKEETR